MTALSHVASPVAAVPLPQGLSPDEVQARRAAGQGHTAPPASERTYAQIVRQNVVTFINTILFLLGLALVLIGRPLDALVSVGVIGFNIAISVVQEIRAKRTLDRVALLTRPMATVIRAGLTHIVAPQELVIGDVVAVTPGDQIVLDGYVLDGALTVDESQLSGESDLIPKRAGTPVYSGSFCVAGSGYYVVEKVGLASLATRITAGARHFRRVLTPLQRQIHLVIKIMLLIVLYLQLLVSANAVLHLVPLAEAIGQATILASLVPNGLFLSIAVAYALGAVRVTRFGAVVQQANAIESLSNVDVLCLDKTGTLTANRLRVSELLPLSLSAQELQLALGAMAVSASTPTKTSEAIAAAFPSTSVPLAAEVPFSSTATVFGRITPQQKEQLVDALRAQRHYVAMIGDGVNDVLALKKADLAIALQGGTQAARGVADIVLVNDSFAALAPAVAEGQRILNGMQRILMLFLARISTVALVILSALVIGHFPLALRNGAVVTLLTVGIPSVLLALWAEPGARPRDQLARDLMHVVVPDALLSSLLGPAVFYGTLVLHVWLLGLLQSPHIALVQRDLAAGVPLAQTALATFLVCCGLLLVILVAPPSSWWVGGTALSGDRRPALLALLLMLAFVGIVAVPPLRRLFSLIPLDPSVYLLIAGLLCVWLLLIRLIWRRRLLERFLGLTGTDSHL